MNNINFLCGRNKDHGALLRLYPDVKVSNGVDRFNFRILSIKGADHDQRQKPTDFGVNNVKTDAVASICY